MIHLSMRALVALLVIVAIGCGQGMKSTGGAYTAATAANVDEQMNKAAKASADAQTAMSDAMLAISTILSSNGSINGGLFSLGQGPLAPLIDKIQPVFDKVYDKALMVKKQFETARAALADAVAKLNPNDPAQAATIAQIMEQMKQIDGLELKFEDTMHSLATKLNLAMTGIDQLVNMATSLIPIPGLNWIVGMAIDYLLVNDVKTMIQNFQMKLLAL